MGHLSITKGLDIPITGKPAGHPRPLDSTTYALDLVPFEEVKFRLLVAAGDKVKRGQPLVEDKASPGRMFVSPAGGTVYEIRRGLKRRLLDISVKIEGQEEVEQYPLLGPAASRQDLFALLKKAGLFAYIRQRPFDRLANPEITPRAIFVKALESAPLTPPAEMQIEGYHEEFHQGLHVLSRLTDGLVHIVYREGTTCEAFFNAPHAEKHTAEGPHPIANPSVHIQEIDPIRSPDDVIWTLDARAVVAIGYIYMHGRTFVDKVISVAGPGVIEGRAGYFHVREGCPVETLVANRLPKKPVRLISGNPLTGREVAGHEFLGFYDTAFCLIPENTERQFLHFLRLGGGKYTFSHAYATSTEDHPFTTSLHGEHRPIIDNVLFDQVMPLDISTTHLLRALLAEDEEAALKLGLLDVASEDFALPAFVDPSKTEMVEIVSKGLKRTERTEKD